MELYKITEKKATNLDYIKDIINDAGVDSRVNRDILSAQILKDCGERYPRYNTTSTFYYFAVEYFKSDVDFIKRTLDLIEAEYDPLNTIHIEKNEKIDREHKEDIDRTRTDNLLENRTGSYTEEHFVSAENEDGAQLRTRDTHTDTDANNAGIKNTGTQKNTADNVFTHDDNIQTTENGYKTSPNKEFFNAIARNEFNFYEALTARFAERLCLGVF